MAHQRIGDAVLIGAHAITAAVDTVDPAVFLGPYAALAFALAGLWLFATGRVLSRSVVRREDYDALLEINVSKDEIVRTLATSQDNLTTAVRHWQKNGNGNGGAG